MRLFLGVELTAQVKNEIKKVQQRLHQMGLKAANWSNSDNLHITLNFLGEVAKDKLIYLSRVGESAALQQSAFALQISEVGAFEKSRILWLGIRRNGAYEELCHLQGVLSQGLSDFPGYTPDTRPYSPHITLARKLDITSWQTLMQNARGQSSQPLSGNSQTLLTPLEFRTNEDGMFIHVTAICLFESTREGGQLVYPVRERWPLHGKDHLEGY